MENDNKVLMYKFSRGGQFTNFSALNRKQSAKRMWLFELIFPISTQEMTWK